MAFDFFRKLFSTSKRKNILFKKVFLEAINSSNIWITESPSLNIFRRKNYSKLLKKLYLENEKWTLQSKLWKFL